MDARKKFWAATSLAIVACCCENPEENRIKFDALKNKVIENYIKNQKLFSSLSPYFTLDKIYTIEFLSLERVNIEYEGMENGDLAVLSITNENITSSKVGLIMKLDSLNSENLLQLGKLLNEIAVDKIWVMNNYDANRGNYYKEMDLRYNQNLNGLHFHYRLWQDSILDNSFNILTNYDTTGGRLGSSIVWYYR